jgi:hypothetical protein
MRHCSANPALGGLNVSKSNLLEREGIRWGNRVLEQMIVLAGEVSQGRELRQKAQMGSPGWVLQWRVTCVVIGHTRVALKDPIGQLRDEC